MKTRKSVLIFILAVLLCLPVGASADDGAADLTDLCGADASEAQNGPAGLPKDSGAAALTFGAGASFSLAWTDDVPAAQLCLEWQTQPEGATATQYGASGTVLDTRAVPGFATVVIPLLPEARRIAVQASDAGMALLSCRVFGEGALPEPYHAWAETPDHLDYLLIATHPDDDVLYLGSVVPVYGAERGYVGTIAYVTCSSRRRMTEAENGAWEMGLRYYPLFLGFEDVPELLSQRERDKRFPYDALLCGIVRTYRAYRPAVVFAQDRNGEYGHTQHILTSRAAVEAAALAADASYDPESAETFGTWQVQKVFLHLYPENTIVIDATSPLEAFGGRSALEVAKAAFRKHVSQRRQYPITADTGPLPLNLFGMAAGAVPVGDDVFDNIDESLLSSYVPPTPEPTEAPTTEPTEAPTDTPSPTTVPTPTGTPSLQATEAPMPAGQGASGSGRVQRGIITAAAVFGIALAAAAIFAVRRRKGA